MTETELLAFAADLDALVAQHNLLELPGADSNIEALLMGIVQVVERDKQAQTHEGIVACLDGMIIHLREAAFLYYASWK